jgi:flagellar hook assembly protein FlgD
VRVYPVPYVPNDGKRDNGVPYAASDAQSGIVFDQLPAVVKIKIYTLSGQLVTDFDTSNSGGHIQWDVRNNKGKDVASGGYIAVISSPGFKAVIKKLLVVR